MKKLILILFLPIFSFSQTELDHKIFNLINVYRAENNLKTLIWDTIMIRVAKNQVEYMSTTGHLSHDQLEEDSAKFKITKDFNAKFTNHGINFNCVVSENCAVVFNTDTMTLDRVANYVITGWKNSPKHNEVMLDAKVTHAAIFHIAGSTYHEDAINEAGDFFTVTTACHMEWFSLNAYGKK
jgi:uncharacterized protein YkwD